MKNILRFKKIKNKMIAMILLMEIICIIVAIFISYIFIKPPLNDTAIANGAILSDQINAYSSTFYNTIINSTTQIIMSQDLNVLLNQHLQQPSSSSKHSIDLYLNQLASLYKVTNIRGFLIKSPNGEVFNSIVDITDEDKELFYDEWFHSEHKNPYANKLSSLYFSNTLDKDGSVCGAYFSLMHVSNQTFQFITLYNATHLLSSLDNISNDFFDVYIIKDTDNNIFYAFGKDSVYFDYVQNLNQSIPSMENVPHGTVYNRSLGNVTWSIISFVSNTRLNYSYNTIFLLTISLSIFICIFTALLLTPSISRNLSPLIKLTSTMKHVSDGNINVRSNIKTGDEIEFLSDTFNEMLNNMQSWTQSLIEKEKKESYMNYLLLVSQVDPHFIYNTMSIVNLMASRGATDDIITVNVALMELMHNRIGIAHANPFDTIDSEINVITNYMTIMEYSLKRNIHIDIDVEKSVKTLLIPKNILQPIVENSYKHGLYSPDGVAHLNRIKIIIKKNYDCIKITINDNGIGIKPDLLAKLNSKEPASLSKDNHHIGIYNVKERLNYLYSGKAHVYYESTPMEYTLVTIQLPLFSQITVAKH